MEVQNEVRIISMLGDMNNKITDISMNIKDIKERMNKNFELLVDAQMTSNEKIDNISKMLEDTIFRVSVTEAGVGLNSSRIKELNNIR